MVPRFRDWNLPGTLHFQRGVCSVCSRAENEWGGGSVSYFFPSPETKKRAVEYDVAIAIV